MAVIESTTTSLSRDATLLPFLQADYDPVAYLNTTLPTLTTTSRQTQSQSGNLAALSAETQSLLTQLSTQTARLSNTLTQLTDEIIRSGGRLAYEVELLRGEAIGLGDALETELKNDFEVFSPSRSALVTETETENDNGEQQELNGTVSSDPLDGPYLERLHNLTRVRERLDSVTRIFDGAMRWPIAPSELASTSSSLISITSPTNDEETRNQELRAKEFVKQVEDELRDLSLADAANNTDTAEQRIAVFQDIVQVWKGTVEERARAKCLEHLQKLVEDRPKVGLSTTATSSGALPRPVDHRYGNLDTRAFGEGGYNFLQNLRASQG